MLLSLHLENLRFFAHHGLFDEEKLLGNHFELNIILDFHSDKTIITDINDTINYASVYELAKKEMLIPRELLETFLTELAQKIKMQFPPVVHIKMSLYKLSMPIINFEGKIGVSIEQRF